MNKNSIISLTYTLGGEYLLQRGEYVSADIYSNGPVFKINKPMRTVKSAKYDKAYININLPVQFTRMALGKPDKPESSVGRWMRTTEVGSLFLKWNKLSDEQKIEAHIKDYVKDMGGEEYSYEIL